MFLKKRISTCQTYTKFKAENGQKFGITAQIHLVPSLTPSAQTGSFLHLLSTCSLAMLPEPGATHPCQWQAAHQWHLTPGKGTASDPAELQTMGEQIANSKSREAPCLFSSCVVQAKLSLDLLESRLQHHLKTQILNPAKGLLVDQRCSFNTAW